MLLAYPPRRIYDLCDRQRGGLSSGASGSSSAPTLSRRRGCQGARVSGWHCCWHRRRRRHRRRRLRISTAAAAALPAARPQLRESRPQLVGFAER
jgi:hypothetical protein